MDVELSTHGGKKNAYNVLMGKPEGKSQLESPRHRWENNIEMYLRNVSFRNIVKMGPPLWSSGQNSWLRIRRPGFDSWHYQKKSIGSGTGSTQPREYN
jgi:hypothetical protein